MSMNKRVLTTIVPIFIITIGLYLTHESFRTQTAYQTDFDDSIKTSMTILGPSLTANIYNLETNSAEGSLRGMFTNPNIQSALAFSEDKTFFAGIKKGDKNQVGVIRKALLLENYTKKFDATKHNEFYVYDFSHNVRRYIYPLWVSSKDGNKQSLGGIFVIEASTELLENRIFEMIIRLIVGLSVSLIVAIISSYIFFQFHIIKPIVRLMQASLDIANGKFTKIPLPKNRRSDEITMLTDNFNFMVNKIEVNQNLIRGMTEASQKIVQCTTFTEIHEIFLKHIVKLLQAGEVHIWIHDTGKPTEDSIDLKRIPDKKTLDANHPMLKQVIQTREAVQIEFGTSAHHKKGFCVPLINGRGVLLGLIELYFQSSKHKYGEEEVRIAHGLAVSLTTAIENCWKIEEEKEKANMERDLELASAVQDSIVSKIIPTNSHCEVATYYKTAGQFGGDWFGVYEVGENKLLVLFGDVTGHGTPAALITAVMRGSADMLRHFITDPSRGPVDSSLPAQALGYLNECIHGTGHQTYFMTMVAALVDFDSQKIYASSAGHTPPAVITIGETNSVVKYFYPLTGNRLGYQKNSQYESQAFDFYPGQQVIFYTDGIIEGENKVGKEYGMKKFKQSLENNGALYPEELVQKIMRDAFHYFDGVPPKDDIAMLVIRFLTHQEKAA